ncbi:MAG: helix-turn-helix domain-containing protein [Tenericutes bacterium]|nr:helix-turn-helix domain-containing protein [Mycoplasmatota bacterium]
MFERIKNLREDHDLTQEYIAKYLKINRVVYNRYENGLREIPISLLIELADFYNVSIDYITNRTSIKEINRK